MILPIMTSSSKHCVTAWAAMLNGMRRLREMFLMTPKCNDGVPIMTRSLLRKCMHCRSRAVSPAIVPSHAMETEHDGRKYSFSVPNLEVAPSSGAEPKQGRSESPFLSSLFHLHVQRTSGTLRH